MATPESKVRNPVVDWAKQNGFLHFRMVFRPGVRQGTPDDLFIAQGGLHVWVEFKADGKEPTPLQYERLDRLIAHGVAAFWCNNKAEGIAALVRVNQFATLAMAQGGAAN